jgi:hypothetical protein
VQDGRREFHPEGCGVVFLMAAAASFSPCSFFSTSLVTGLPQLRQLPSLCSSAGWSQKKQ